MTNLVNYAQPLIRYELSASVTLADGPDPTGQPYGRIARVVGRSDDILRLPAQAGGEVQVHPYWLRAPFLGFPDIRQYQIVHDQRRLHVRVVLRSSAPRETTASVHAAKLQLVKSTGGVAP
jgi:phenylacetate-coenzyme A ligase PaaK-like adenylate-forming protein